jgi:hypothetical protein
MKPLTTTVLVMALLIGGATASPPKPSAQKEKVLKTTTLKGKFVGFEVGDYVHARIVDSAGEEQTFFVGGPGLDYFLSNYPNKSGTFTIRTVRSNIPEAGGMIEIERVESAKFGTVTSKAWWTSLRKRKSLKAIEKEFRPKIDKLTR